MLDNRIGRPRFIWQMFKRMLPQLASRFFITLAALLSVLCFALFSTDQHAESSYSGAITAQETIVLAVANDLKTYSQHVFKKEIPILEEIHSAAYQLYAKAGFFDESENWLLQPGVLSQHADYRYAGNTRIPSHPHCQSPDSLAPECNLGVNAVEGIGMDVSHFLAKWPVLIQSFLDASAPGTKEERLFSGIRSGIERQFFARVLDYDASTNRMLLLKNYMDGTNGVYRWNYSARGKNWGIPPWGLSCTPFYSAMILLNTNRIANLYSQLYSALPYSEDELDRLGDPYCNSPEARLAALVSSKLHPRQQMALFDRHQVDSVKQLLVEDLLTKDSWVGKKAYSSLVGVRQTLLHAAFRLEQNDWIGVFDRHFQLFLSSLPDVWAQTSAYHKWHYYLFVSRYLALSALTGADSEVADGLYVHLVKIVSDAWTREFGEVVSNYGWGEPKFTNYRDWVIWKIQRADVLSRQ